MYPIADDISSASIFIPAVHQKSTLPHNLITVPYFHHTCPAMTTICRLAKKMMTTFRNPTEVEPRLGTTTIANTTTATTAVRLRTMRERRHAFCGEDGEV